MTVDGLLDLLERGGQARYDGEAVSQLEHALQSAALAEREGAPDSLVTAALFHDIGHLVRGLDESPAARGIDGRHEVLGADLIAGVFGDAVADAVRLHVEAKRYLCATEPAYFRSLSAASKRSLERQGGTFRSADAEAFLRVRGACDAVSVRRWDDRAKIRGATTPDPAHFRPRLLAVARGGQLTGRSVPRV